MLGGKGTEKHFFTNAILGGCMQRTWLDESHLDDVGAHWCGAMGKQWLLRPGVTTLLLWTQGVGVSCKQ